MSTTMTGIPEPPSSRLLGRLDSGRPGPTVVLLAGLHGNEPAGIQAIVAVVGELGRRRPPLRGRIVGLCGNLGALAAGRRYLARDLNRGWTREDVAALLAPGSARLLPEDEEQRGLLRAMAPLLTEAREPLVFLDLHSTSGDSPPFAVMADVLRNRKVGLALPLPLVLGVEETLDSTALGYLCDLGHIAVGVEGGQHLDPRTRANHEAAIWITLVAAGSLAAADVADLAAVRGRLRAAARGVPGLLEVRHRHAVTEGDGFAMVPGFASFQRLARAEVVAQDVRGPIRAPESGYMLMPRYQGQGEDGYFVVRPVSRFWLDLSAWLRRARLDHVVPLLPGVRRDAEQADRFWVDRRVARWQVVNLFHLFGYRQVRSAGGRLAFSRRRPGFRRLDRLPAELVRLGGEGLAS
jgi:succinylglutamate desuccinylase